MPPAIKAFTLSLLLLFQCRDINITCRYRLTACKFDAMHYYRRRQMAWLRRTACYCKLSAIYQTCAPTSHCLMYSANSRNSLPADDYADISRLFLSYFWRVHWSEAFSCWTKYVATVTKHGSAHPSDIIKPHPYDPLDGRQIQPWGGFLNVLVITRRAVQCECAWVSRLTNLSRLRSARPLRDRQRLISQQSTTQVSADCLPVPVTPSVDGLSTRHPHHRIHCTRKLTTAPSCPNQRQARPPLRIINVDADAAWYWTGTRHPGDVRSLTPV